MTMNYSDAEAIVNGLRYKPRHTIRIWREPGDRALIAVNFVVPDIHGPDKPDFQGTWLGKPFNLGKVRNIEALMIQVHTTISHFEGHEILENLTFNGEQVWEPHELAGTGCWDINKAPFNIKETKR